jgi:hypothetical protein
MDDKIRDQIKALIAKNQALEAENETLRKELLTCIETIENVFGKILNKKGQFDMQRVMGLITNPAAISEPIEQLMIIIEKHGQTKKSE